VFFSERSVHDDTVFGCDVKKTVVISLTVVVHFHHCRLLQREIPGP